MIDIICRVQHRELYDRMAKSAYSLSSFDDISFHNETNDGLPKLSETFNRLGVASEGDILVFLHDDVHFLSPGWDVRLIEALRDFDIAGVVGSDEYAGGNVFDAGISHGRGKYACVENGETFVKIFNESSAPQPAKVLDGMFLAVTREHFKNHKFDTDFDGLFFYDLDYCLGGRCCVADILVSHDKPAQYYGVYPKDMKPKGFYWDKFHEKHGLNKNVKPVNQVCSKVRLESFATI